jgi:hypothetical protein
MLSKTTVAIQPLLAFWQNSITDESSLHFADLFVLTHGTEGYKSYVNSFADENYLAIVRPWIRNRKVAHAFFDQVESIAFGSRSFGWETEQNLEFTLDNLPRYL